MVRLQKRRHTCDLDDSGNPVYFTRQDCVCVQDLHLHPYSNVVPLLTHGDLQEVRHLSYRSFVCALLWDSLTFITYNWMLTCLKQVTDAATDVSLSK